MAHLSEALETSGNETRSEEHSHQWMDENGWIYRTAYFMDKNGAIYEATLNIADGRRGKILYDINKIRRIDDGDVPSTTKGRGSLININPSGTMVAQNEGIVKKNVNKPYAISRTLPRAGENSSVVLPTAKEQMERVQRQRRAAEAKTETERTGILYGATDENIEMAGRISKAINREVVFYENADPNVKNDAGYYNSRDGKIYINAKSKNSVAYIIAHEMTHSIELADTYIDLCRTVVRHIQKTGGSIADMRSELKNRYEKNGVKLSSTGEVNVEVVAEYIADHLLTDEASITSLAAENRKGASAILHFLDNLLAKLGNTNARERVFVENARKFYARALNETANTEHAAEHNAEARAQEAPTEAESRAEANANGERTDTESVLRQTLRPEIAENTELMQMLNDKFGADGTAALVRQIKAEVEKTGTVGKFGVLFSDGGRGHLGRGHLGTYIFW